MPDPVDLWSSRFLIAAFCAVAAVLIVSIIRYRGRPAGAASWGLLIAGIGVLPLASAGFGTLVALHRSQRVAYCASCHSTMGPFVEDMNNPRSESLAAVHFRNKYIGADQCYACHTSYGPLPDAYGQYAGGFRSPIGMRRPYSNHDCLACHGDSAKWLQNRQHVVEKADLLADKVKCLDCHGVEHPAHSLAQKAAMVWR